ncbi:MAG: Asp23/Gls24 family envelope stress response protein [Chloroflexi bacterium]|nr:Asp23/Gls24 family envelope stress response protein [Chloroflexota bacterium]
MAGKLGSVRISPEVLATIARLTALNVPGVAHMHSALAGNVDRLFHGRGSADGVRVQVVDNAVNIDLSLIAFSDVNLLEMGQAVQQQVARAIQTLVGMPVLAVNVRIEDVVIAPRD